MNIRWSNKNSTQPFSVLPNYYFTFILILIMHRYVENCSADNDDDYGLINVFPRGEIIVKVSESLKLYCTLNKNYEKLIRTCGARETTHPQLSFQLNDGEFVQQQSLTHENETTISMILANTEESKNKYSCSIPIRWRSRFYNFVKTCRLNYDDSDRTRNNVEYEDFWEKIGSGQDRLIPKEVASTVVVVGTGPKMVENVSCISYNWRQLKCTWDVPKNYLETNYTIQYMPNDDRFKNFSECPNNDDVRNNSCTWTLSSKPPYYRNYETFTIIIRGVNRLDETEQLFTINHFDHVLPEGPDTLRLVNRTCTSMLLEWDIGDFRDFPKNLTYKITYEHICDSKWLTCGPKQIIIDGENRSYVVTNLVPNMLYDFRVHMKVLNASEKFWSKTITNQTTTLSCPPFRCPKTDVGSFHVEESDRHSKTRTVFIYWELLHPFEHNGKNFSYQINVSIAEGVDSGNQPNVVRLNSGFDSYAKYKIGFFSYLFYITAQNNEGRAPNASIVKVSSEFMRIRSDPLLWKIDQQDRNSSELTWMPLQRIIDDYTIFLWRIEIFRPFQCDSFIQWTHVPANATKYLLSSNISSDYQFAISINTPDSNSGMMWITSQHGTTYQPKSMELDKNGLDTKPTVDIGWRFSDNEQKKRMEQLFNNTCVIRIKGISNRAVKECFPKKSNHTRN